MAYISIVPCICLCEVAVLSAVLFVVSGLSKEFQVLPIERAIEVGLSQKLVSLAPGIAAHRVATSFG